MEERLLVVSVDVNDDEQTLKNLKQLIDEHQDKFKYFSEEKQEAYFEYADDLYQRLVKQLINQPELTNLLLVEGLYSFNDETGEYDEEDYVELVSEGEQLSQPKFDNHSNNDYQENTQQFSMPGQDQSHEVNYDDNINNWFSGQSFSLSGADNQNNHQVPFQQDTQFTSVPSHEEELSSGQIQQEETQNHTSQVSDKVQSYDDQQDFSTNKEDVLEDIANDVIPDYETLLNRLNSHLKINDEYAHVSEPAAMLKAVHNSSILQMYYQIEDDIYHLKSNEGKHLAEKELAQFREQFIQSPNELKDELASNIIKLREFKQQANNEINEIKQQYPRQLEEHVKKAGEEAKERAEQQAKVSFQQQYPDNTQQKITEYVLSIADTEDSIISAVDQLKKEVNRSVVRSFIENSNNQSLKSALKFVDYKQRIEHQANKDLESLKEAVQHQLNNHSLSNLQATNNELNNNASDDIADFAEALDDIEFDENEFDQYDTEPDEIVEGDSQEVLSEEDDYEDVTSKEAKETMDSLSDDEDVNEEEDFDVDDEEDIDEDQDEQQENENNEELDDEDDDIDEDEDFDTEDEDFDNQDFENDEKEEDPPRGEPVK